MKTKMTNYILGNFANCLKKKKKDMYYEDLRT